MFMKTHNKTTETSLIVLGPVFLGDAALGIRTSVFLKAWLNPRVSFLYTHKHVLSLRVETKAG